MDRWQVNHLKRKSRPMSEAAGGQLRGLITMSNYSDHDNITTNPNASAIIPWPALPNEENETTWFSRQEQEPESVTFVAWNDPAWGWRRGKVDGQAKPAWGSVWVHVKTREGYDKWKRWEEIPLVQ